MSSISVLVVDDYKDWQNEVRLLLKARPECEVISEASDGLEAIEKAGELKPDLIVLDIGLPKLDGIEAAQRILQVSPNSKIVFLSTDNSTDVMQAALSAGGRGYVHKVRAHYDLLPAIDAALRGKQFVSGVLGEDTFAGMLRQKAPHRHEVLFYSAEAVLLDSLTRFISAALAAGDAAIVLATQSHRDSLIERLKTQGIDINTALRDGSYFSLDNATNVSTFMVNDMPDPTLFFEAGEKLIRAARRGHSRVVACGECAPHLWAEGKPYAAIQLERLWDQLVAKYELDTLCVYPLRSFRGEQDKHIFESICAEHSAIYSQAKS